MSTNPFASSTFTKGLADIQARADASRVANSNTSQQRMGLGDTSTAPTTNKLVNNATNNVSIADRQSMANLNDAIRNNPVFQTNVSNNNRDFAEDTRRFDAGLNFKNTADQRANDTQRLGYNNQLEGTKYNADAGVKSTALQADASKYGADRGVDVARLGADASRYGADRGVDQARIGATAQVDSARIGADASRFNALLGAGTAFFNSSQYRPTFNR